MTKNLGFRVPVPCIKGSLQNFNSGSGSTGSGSGSSNKFLNHFIPQEYARIQGKLEQVFAQVNHELVVEQSGLRARLFTVQGETRG